MSDPDPTPSVTASGPFQMGRKVKVDPDHAVIEFLKSIRDDKARIEKRNARWLRRNRPKPTDRLVATLWYRGDMGAHMHDDTPVVREIRARLARSNGVYKPVAPRGQDGLLWFCNCPVKERPRGTSDIGFCEHLVALVTGAAELEMPRDEKDRRWNTYYFTLTKYGERLLRARWAIEGLRKK